ncbi:hypothetical protein ACS0TY_004950 [Phlomoides rotata]
MGVGFYASGKLHWRRLDLIYSCDIVSFDLSSHVYGLVGLPSCTEGKFFQWLGVLRGCLSVHKFHRNGDLDVWLMKENGVRDSLEKVATVSFYNDLPNDSIPNPLAIGPNGEILLIYQSSFVIYNPKCDIVVLLVSEAAMGNEKDTRIKIPYYGKETMYLLVMRLSFCLSDMNSFKNTHSANSWCPEDSRQSDAAWIMKIQLTFGLGFSKIKIFDNFLSWKRLIPQAIMYLTIQPLKWHFIFNRKS